jgi:hypothetical protein
MLGQAALEGVGVLGLLLIEEEEAEESVSLGLEPMVREVSGQAVKTHV